MISDFNSLPVANAAPVIGMMQPLFRFDVTPGVEAQVSLQETRVMIQTPPWPPVQVTSLNIPLLRQTAVAAMESDLFQGR
ncbi:MAG: hypothetical protein CR976_02950 [Thiotrichales bacterium]|nr:MAG: hypothetical protein CR976_02950 [Thiotrichales bacterium]